VHFSYIFLISSNASALQTVAALREFNKSEVFDNCENEILRSDFDAIDEYVILWKTFWKFSNGKSMLLTREWWRC